MAYPHEAKYKEEDAWGELSNCNNLVPGTKTSGRPYNLCSTLSVAGATTLSSTLNVKGQTTVQDLYVNGRFCTTGEYFTFNCEAGIGGAGSASDIVSLVGGPLGVVEPTGGTSHPLVDVRGDSVTQGNFSVLPAYKPPTSNSRSRGNSSSSGGGSSPTVDLTTSIFSIDVENPIFPGGAIEVGSRLQASSLNIYSSTSIGSLANVVANPPGEDSNFLAGVSVYKKTRFFNDAQFTAGLYDGEGNDIIEGAAAIGLWVSRDGDGLFTSLTVVPSTFTLGGEEVSVQTLNYVSDVTINLNAGITSPDRFNVERSTIRVLAIV